MSKSAAALVLPALTVAIVLKAAGPRTSGPAPTFPGVEWTRVDAQSAGTTVGYGYLWWVFDPARFAASPLAGAYTASGSYGQYITVVPALDLVVAHKTAVPPPRNVTNEQYFGVILPQVVKLFEDPATRAPR